MMQAAAPQAPILLPSDAVDMLVLPTVAKVKRAWQRQRVMTTKEGLYTRNTQLGARLAQRIEQPFSKIAKLAYAARILLFRWQRFINARQC